jgi:hypothetical protein
LCDEQKFKLTCASPKCARLGAPKAAEVLFDRDAKYRLEGPIAIRSMKIDRIQTSYKSPWQNGIAERWGESCRRDLLEHVIALKRAALEATSF